MADKTAKSNKADASSSAPEERWRSGRSRFNLLRFSRGENKEWYFSGQQQDEKVRRVVRKHWRFLIQPAFPLLGCTVAFFLIIWAALAFPALGAFWYLLEIATFLGILVTGAWFAYKDLIAWWYDMHIITNKRIITASGVLDPKRQVTPLDKVQQVEVEVKNLLELLMGFGTVHVYLAGSKLLLHDVPGPYRVRDAIVGITEEIASTKKKDAPLPQPKDPSMVDVLSKLAKEKPVPKLPDPDEGLPPLRIRHAESSYRGPRRTFGGILRIPCNVRYLPGEHTVKYVQRSQYVLLRKLLIPILLLLVLFPLVIVGPATGWVPNVLLSYWWFCSVLVIAGLMISMGLVYSNYVDDVYLITSKRIIDIERFFIFFSEKHDEAELKNIRDVKVRVANLLERVLDIGDVIVETPGNSPNIIFSNVDHPFVLQDEILGVRAHEKKVDDAKRENNEKKTFNTWFSTVMTALESQVSSRGTPDLRDKDLLTAMSDAQEYGFDVVVSGEAIDNPHMPPGCVVRQSPPYGTVMEKGSKIEVVLSRRPVPAVD
jgi:membrane protein YdbS with pleckstrin-like domain